jgi:hypothetical protein
VHGAFAERYSAFWLGGAEPEGDGRRQDLTGIVVSDRYQNYFSAR